MILKERNYRLIIITFLNKNNNKTLVYIISFTELLWVMRLSWFPYLLFQLCQESCPVCWIRDALLARFSKALVVRGRRFSAFASVVGMTWRKFRHFLCHKNAFWLFLVWFPLFRVVIKRPLIFLLLMIPELQAAFWIPKSIQKIDSLN